MKNKQDQPQNEGEVFSKFMAVFQITPFQDIYVNKRLVFFKGQPNFKKKGIGLELFTSYVTNWLCVKVSGVHRARH
jgi:hypothetical protein